MSRTRIDSNKKGDLKSAYRLLPYVWKHKRLVIFALLALTLAKLANVAVPVVLKHLVDSLEQPIQAASIPIALVVAYGLFRFGSLVFNEIRNYLFAKIRVDLVIRLSTQLFSHLNTLSLRFHLDRKTGELARDLERGIQAVSTFLRNLVFNVVPVILELAMVLVLIGLQFSFSYVLIILVTIIIYIIFTYYITLWRTPFRVAMNKHDSEANAHAIEALINYETVKTFTRERDELKRYHEALDQWSDASVKGLTSLSILNIGQGIIITVGLLLLLSMAANGVMQQTLSVGDFVMLNAFMLQLYIPLSFLGSLYRDINHSLVDMERLFVLMDRQPEIVDSPDAKSLKLENGSITFDNIGFAYEAGQPILKDLSFVVPGGKTVAIVGPSGAGKSTLSRLLLRFFEPTAGSISIDGQNIRHVTAESLRKNIATVPQDTVLFNDTIGYNIAYGNPDADAGAVEAAARLAQLHTFVTGLPEQYETRVGERGLKLSGGEKQRVAIARAALKNAPILLFDEATSSLDSRSERAIQDALAEVAKNHTTLIIAHRLSTIVDADEILVLEKGNIVQRGQHHELVKQDGLYQQMWSLQENKTVID